MNHAIVIASLILKVCGVAAADANRFIQPFRLIDRDIVDSVAPDEILRLFRTPIRTGVNGPDGYRFLRDAHGGQYRTVKTVEQYRAALELGAEPMTTFDLAMNSWFAVANLSLEFMRDSGPSTFSHLPEPLLPNLPVGILLWVGDEERMHLERDDARGRRLYDYWRVGITTRWKLSASDLQFRHHDYEYTITEIARGDYDRDGGEESLIECYSHAALGTGFLQQFLVVKHNPGVRGVFILKSLH